MQVALLLSTLQVVWSLPEQVEGLSSPRCSGKSRHTAGFLAAAEGHRGGSRPYSASPRSPAERRVVWSSTEQLGSMKVSVVLCDVCHGRFIVL